MNKPFLQLLLLLIVLFASNSQTTTTNPLVQVQIPGKIYNFTMWDGHLNMDRAVFCEVMDSTGTNCTKCISGWNARIFSSTRCMLSFPVWDCYGYDWNLNCQICHPGFYIKYGNYTYPNLCISKKVGCSVYDENRQLCLECQPGYTMNTTANPFAKLESESFCYFIPDKNCVLYDAAGTTCQSCASNYVLSKNQCNLWLPNCAIMNGNLCQKCSVNYEVNTFGNCSFIARILNCLIQTEYLCESCMSGYRLQNNQCIFIIDNCLKVKDQVCTECNAGFVINIDGKCSLILRILNCETQVVSTCQKCLSNYVLMNNQCIFTMPNCLQNDGKVCTKCQADYMINLQGQCQTIPKIADCAWQAGYLCLSCNAGFNLKNDMCVYNIENCLKISGTICAQCAENYVISSDGKCNTEQVIVYDPNCRLYDNVTLSKCLQCSKGFFLNLKMVCQQVDPLCQTYNTNNGFCLSCYVGYTIDLITGKCNIAIINNTILENCNEFDYTKNICVKCAQGSIFDEFGRCRKFADENCKLPSQDMKTCLQCYKGYYFDAVPNKCLVGNYNCATWKNGKCQTCPKGFYLNRLFNCTPVDSLCMFFNPAANMCLMCYPGYAFDADKVCKQIKNLPITTQKYNTNCARFNDKSQCILCFNGWFLTQDTAGSFCQRVNDLCKTYSMSTGKCTSCYLGYFRDTKGDCTRVF